MRILITGGLGFIGSAAVRYALKNGHQVLNLDCATYASCYENLSSFEMCSNYSFKLVDLREKEILSDVFSQYRPDAVMHLAAETHVDRSINDPSIFLETNVIGTFNLLQASLQYWDSPLSSKRFRFHHVSTDEVFGSLPLNSNEQFSEVSIYNPSSPYSASKASSDHLSLAWHHTYGLPVLLTNCSNNYGPFQFPEKFIPLTIINALSDKPIPIFGTGDNVRDWVFVEDHVDALFVVLEHGKIGRRYNIGGNHELKNIDLAEKFVKF